ncbi:unnamed protein product [Coccothraustes coccothraustes]
MGPDGTGSGSEPVRPLPVWGPLCALGSRACRGTGHLGGLRALLLGQNCLGTAHCHLKFIAVVRKETCEGIKLSRKRKRSMEARPSFSDK